MEGRRRGLSYLMDKLHDGLKARAEPVVGHLTVTGWVDRGAESSKIRLGSSDKIPKAEASKIYRNTQQWSQETWVPVLALLLSPERL